MEGLGISLSTGPTSVNSALSPLYLKTGTQPAYETLCFISRKMEYTQNISHDHDDITMTTYHCKIILTNYLTPRSRDLLKKQTGPQLAKKFPEFNGHRRFITTFTRSSL